MISRTIRGLLLLSFIILVLLSGCASSAGVTVSEVAEVWYNLGNAYNELDRHQDAVEAYSRARELEPELFSAGYNLARVYIYLKKYDESLELLDELLKTDPANRTAAETKAWVYHLQGDNSTALDIYNEILSESPANRNSLYNSAMILKGRGENTLSLERLLDLVEYYPGEKTVYFDIAFIEAELNNHENALGWLQKQLVEVPDDLRAYELSGDIYASLSRFGEAVAEYREALSLNEKTAEDDEGESIPDSDISGRLNFKIAEIFLVYIEDESEGIAALEEVEASGWGSDEDFKRLFSNEEVGWFTAATEILDYDPETGEDQDGEDAEEDGNAEPDKD